MTLNTESDSLQQSFFHAHAIEWIIVNVVLLESWFAKVRCIHLLMSLSWIFQQKKSVCKGCISDDPMNRNTACCDLADFSPQ